MISRRIAPFLSTGLTLVAIPAAAQNQPKSQGPAEAEVRVARPQTRPFAPDRLANFKTPEKFNVGVFAENLGRPRMLHVLDDGTVLVTRPHTNDVVALRDRDGDGRADSLVTVFSGIEKVHGIARKGRTLFLAGTKKLLAAEVRSNGGFGPTRTLLNDLPDGGQHPLRTVGVGRDGLIYLSVGSDCNDCNESNPEHATMLQVKPDGKSRSIFARGLRNTIGFDWHPKTGDLWGADIGTDWRGDDRPPEELNKIVQDGHYGWPTCWGAREIDPTREDPEGITRAKLCAESKPPALVFPAHASPIALTFYGGSQFPAEFRDDAFVALHGSWNRSNPQPPSVLRIRFENGQPRHAEEFLTGFLIDGGKAWFGRPAGLAVARDGALLVSDDENGVIYTITYGKPAPRPGSDRPSGAGLLSRLYRVPGLDTPESVLHDEQQDVYFVSNIAGNPGAKDGNGFVSRLLPDGKLEAAPFIQGGRNGVTLHAPKGMAIVGQNLWVADIDAVRGFDRKTGAPFRTVDLASSGAVFLNDLAVGPDDVLIVSDTGLRFDEEKNRSHPGPDRVFRIFRDGKTSVLLEGPALEGPNGLAWDAQNKVFLLAQNLGKNILTFGPGGGRTKLLVSGPGAFDGVVALGDGTFLVSSHHDNVIYRVASGQMTPLLPSPPTPGDIGFDRKRRRLLIPSLQGGWVDIWQLPQPRTAS